jgi:hypothetical protein
MALAEISQEPTESKRSRKRKQTGRSAALTMKMAPEAVKRIEKAVAEVQTMAKTRAPDKADVLVWMLATARPEDLRTKMDAWNEVFS